MTMIHRNITLHRAVAIMALFAIESFSLAQDDAKQADKSKEQAGKGQRVAARCLAFSPDGALLAVGHGNNEGPGRLVVWNLDKRQPLFAQEWDEIVPSVAFSPDSKLLAVASFTPTLHLVDPSTGKLRRKWKAHEHHVRSVVFNPAKPGELATSSYDRTIKLWRSSGGDPQRVLMGRQSPLRVIAYSPDGKWLAAAGGEDEMVLLWNLDDADAEPREFKMKGYVPQVAFSPDSRTLAVSVWVEGPVLFDVATGNELERLTNLGGIHWTAFSPDGRWLAVASNGRDVYIFPAKQAPTDETRREIAELIKQFEEDDYAQREAASKRLAELAGEALPQLREGLKSDSAEVRIRCRRLIEQAQSGVLARKLTGHGEELECLAFSADGKYLASGDWRGLVKIWNVETWENVTTLDYATQ